MTACFRCDIEIETTLPGNVQHALCDDCRLRLQRKVDSAVKELEFEMVGGRFQRKGAAARAWYVPTWGRLAFFGAGVTARVVLHWIGWWR